MGALFEKIKTENMQALKDGDKIKKSILTVLVGDFTTEAKRKNTEVTDELALDIIRKVEKSITQTITLTLGHVSSAQSEQLKILRSYLPTMLTKDQVIKLIEDNGCKNKKEAFSYLNVGYKRMYPAEYVLDYFKDKSNK